jgi:hypothetical protein
MKNLLSGDPVQTLLHISAVLWLALAASVEPAPAQEEQQAPADPRAHTTRKIDAYGQINDCDEKARLDNFAISLQSEPSARGYLMIYTGRDDLPARIPAILGRAADYLVQTRGLDPSRVQVVDAGYRAQRTTELWLVAGGDPAPEKTDTVEVTREPGKAYQWDLKGIDIEYYPDEETDEEPSAEDGAEGAEGAQEAQDAAVEGTEATEEETTDEESEPEARWRKGVEKYEIAVESREPFEGDASDGPPLMGTLRVSLWWNVEGFVRAWRSEPEARACLIYYHGADSVGPSKMSEVIARARAKLEEQLGGESGRLVVIDGGYSRDPGVELWIVPKGASLPEPRPVQVEPPEAGSE